MYLSLSLSLYLSLSLSFFLIRSCVLNTLIRCLKGHNFLGSLFECALEKYFSLSLSLSLSFFGQVMSPQHSDQRSQVSGIALFSYSLSVFVFVIVIVFVFVFVIVFFLVRSCLVINLIKCLKGRKSLGSLCC